jgi:phosphotriesterase-related protein
VILGEFQTGIGTTGIKPGVIKGACGGPPVPWHPEEKKVLTAICRAQREIGCPFTFHPLDMDDKRRKRLMIADEYVNLIEREGAMKEKFYLSHADDTCEDLEYHRRLMDRGIALNYDCFGSEVYWEKSFVGCRNPSDAERVSAVAKLCSEGYEGSLMLSHDICRKDRYRRYGGYTYSHILEVIVPRLRAMGIKQKQIRKMLVENPRRILAF